MPPIDPTCVLQTELDAVLAGIGSNNYHQIDAAAYPTVQGSPYQSKVFEKLYPVCATKCKFGRDLKACNCL